MTEYPAKRDPNRPPSHSGEILADIIPDIGKTKSEIATLLGMSRQHLHDILGGRKPLPPTVSARRQAVWRRRRDLAFPAGQA